jgi:signal transduction histidine kinase/ligand-binding sensor domain-containing protein/DNA-binding response OmpR family regulator
LLSAAPTQFKFNNVSIEEGLSNNYVNFITQDHKGFIWIGTGNGLNRFDGMEIITYNHNPIDTASLRGNIINVVFEDNKKNLWIGTNEGISLYNRGKDNFKQKPLYEIGYIPINDIYQDRQGEYWFCANGTGVFHYSKELEFIENLTHQKGSTNCINSDITTKIIEDHHALLWIASDKGFCSYDRNTRKFTQYKHEEQTENSLTDNSINSLFEDTQRNLWICTANGLNKLSFSSNKIEHFSFQTNNNKSIPALYVYQVAQDRFNNIWAVTKNGLFKRNNTKNNFIQFESSNTNETYLKTGQITNIFIDRQDILWFGTTVNGVLYAYSENKTFEYNDFICRKLKNISVLSILRDRKGSTWIGTDGYGLYLFKSAGNEYEHFSSISKNNEKPEGIAVLSLFEDKEGYIWIGTYKNGLYKYDNRQGSFIQFLNTPDDPTSLSNNDVRDITEDDLGNILVATNGGGLSIYIRNKNSFVQLRNNPNDYQHSLINDGCTRILADSKGIYWIGTYDGLSKYDPVEQSFINYRHYYDDNNQYNSINLSNNWIFSIYEDSKHRIWVGTAEGLNQLNPEAKSFKQYYKSSGLPDNSINGITGDEQGCIWISTKNGISKFDVDKNRFNNFDYYYGLQGNEFNSGAYYKDALGTVYFGGLSGINIFNPNSIILNNYIPPIVITEIKVNNNILSDDKKGSSYVKKISDIIGIELSYKQNTITIKFASLNYIDSRKNEYAIKLEGFDKDWLNIGAQRIYTYANLKPGKYIIRVKGSNNNNVWNNTGTSLKITIHQPFWNTIWAYLFYILLIVAALYFYRVFTIIKISTKKDLLLEHFKREKSEELNQLKLRFFTNISHEFRTPLTLIMAPVEKMLKSGRTQKNELLLVHKNARRLLHLINQLLDFRKVESGKLSLEIQKGDIIKFVKQIASAFEVIAEQKQIKLKIYSSEQALLLWFDHDKMEKIIYNLLSNAFKFTQNNGSIVIHIDKLSGTDILQTGEGEYVQISVSDTGIGIPKEKIENLFTEFYQSHNSDHDVGSGLGLAFTRELVESHRGKIFVTSELQKGSCFSVVFPMGDKHYSEEQLKGKPGYSFPAKEIQEMISNEFESSYHDNVLATVDANDTFAPSATAQVILIVEDNFELRSFMSKSLIPRFRIIEASNGLEAYDLAVHESPDLIISDIMMPEMDGIELCRKIKNNLQTNHISVILLTAKQADESRFEGIKTGADDYIIKPFDVRELMLKIENIIKTRENLLKKYHREILLTPKDITATSADEKFIIDVMGLIETNIKDPDFDLMALASKIGISRSVLYRKMQKLMNQSPNEFVNSIRLKKAARLLKQKRFKVSDVAYEVGYKDPLYFSKCFKKQFDFTPSEFIKLNT